MLTSVLAGLTERLSKIFLKQIGRAEVWPPEICVGLFSNLMILGMLAGIAIKKEADFAQDMFFCAACFSFFFFVVGALLTVAWPRTSTAQMVIGLILNFAPFWVFIVGYVLVLNWCHVRFPQD